MKCFSRFTLTVFVVLVLGIVVGSGGVPLTFDEKSFQRQAIQASTAPTLPPTRAPLRVILARHPSDSSGRVRDNNDEAPSNDGGQGGGEEGNGEEEAADTGSTSNSGNITNATDTFAEVDTNEFQSKESNQTLTIVAICLAVIAFTLCILGGCIWRKYLWHDFCTSSKNDAFDERHNVGTDTSTHVPPERRSTLHVTSILRNNETPATSNNGQKVRFSLPGNTATGLITKSKGHRKSFENVQAKEPKRTPYNSRKVKIIVEGPSIAQKIPSPPPLLPPILPDLLVDTGLEENDPGAVPKPPLGSDPQAWVTHIMNPWLDSHLCCPDQWEQPIQSSNQKVRATNSVLDQMDHCTVATNDDSIQSSTPMLPPFPTSSACDESKSEENENSIEDNVLGIKTKIEDSQDVWTSAPKPGAPSREKMQTRLYQNPQPASPACNYGREDRDDQNAAMPNLPSEFSSWRMKAWAQQHHGSLRGLSTQQYENIDDVDIESCSGVGGGSSSASSDRRFEV